MFKVFALVHHLKIKQKRQETILKEVMIFMSASFCSIYTALIVLFVREAPYIIY